MHIDIQAHGFKLSEALREHVERRLRFAFGSTSARIRHIAVRLSDENGPRGGMDKRCAIRVSVPGAPPLLTEQYETDLYVAIDRAADRAGRTLARWLGRGPSARRGTGLRAALRTTPAVEA